MTTFTNLLVSFIFLIASFFILSSSVFAEHAKDHKETASEPAAPRDQDRAGKTVEEKRDIDSEGPRSDAAENTPIDAPSPKVDRNQPSALVNPTDPSGPNVTSPTGKNPDQPMRSNRPSGTDR